jgi:hypothetical protein
MPTRAYAATNFEQRIEAASRRVDRDARDMLESLEDEIIDREYDEQVHAMRARSGGFAPGDQW